ncbi:tRNA (adenine-N(1))-methyltransferase [Brevibacillus sp. SYP-B805]|uniref:tRNA (adenine(22)-N(1))-methyltransferase n=1 Tax=Brevibacillus sp. SYP-B805 TaxID=1578199 RepID=UPI0013E9CED8|nr:tRNA (adenine(22)-N(1))-methyltransferase TrmK [Brevibacillus sp. SYP-B805]NGQ94096.1 tRNA (adenine-N(1))-methyltransferase [Brevibacillus sp. SYP-B805]
MTALTISRRLRTVAEYCLPGAKVADIGSDHALLASYLLVHNLASFVIAGELNEGPYQAALRQIHTLQARDRASVRKGDGLAVIAPGEVDVICIAGMGGQLITAILEKGKSKLPGVKRLVLQPNVGEELVRRWLLENGWQLIGESILEEDGIIYEILVAEPGDPYVPYQGQSRTLEELIRIGPCLWQQKDPVLVRKWQREQEKWRSILAQVKSSGRPEAAARIKEIQTEIDWMEEVIACLQAGN